MSFDSHTRNLLARMVAVCRDRLAEDISDQLQTRFGIYPDGSTLDVARTADEQSAAADLRALLAHFEAGDAASNPKTRAKNAYQRLAREIGFTTLNRLAALRLCEGRDLVIEAVGKGMESAGFQLYDRVSNGALGNRYQTYRAFIEGLYDELALDLGVLFERSTPHSHIFPGEAALAAVLNQLDDPELTRLGVWEQDETIGWIYQYYNDPKERKAMRDASEAPRNSRELAVRNQFFTPRYVVEFLTDNTLGRIWYEMTKGQTGLVDTCAYLVRHPTEIIMAEGEQAPGRETTEAELSQEELLRQPVFVPHRQLKDPREIKILDPACGSMHFGLYTFDLFERMYAEAWELEEDLGAQAFWRMADLTPLHEAYRDKSAFLRDVPRLIIEHNIHGVDIDPRAAQIAALALWLRAQRAWMEQGLPPARRPKITKTHIVTAEAMPGDRALLDEFVTTLKPPLVGDLVRVVFEKMKLAGEAGTLLKIETELSEAIHTAKQEWLKRPKAEQLHLWAEQKRPKLEQMPLFDTSGISDDQFWLTVEDQVLGALQDYAERATNGKGARRRLFAEDAIQGFAFIELCQLHYDVLLMNPPFGDASLETENYFREVYPDWNFNLFCSFINRACKKASFVGAITDRAYMVKTSYEGYRRNDILDTKRLHLLVDLGWGILDANVEVNLQVFVSPAVDSINILDLTTEEDKEETLRGAIQTDQVWINRPHGYFANLPNGIISYLMPQWQRKARKKGKNITEIFAVSKSGLKAGRVDQFVRLFWEVDENHRGTKTQWNYFQNGGPYSPYYFSTNWVVLYETEWKSIRSIPSSRITGLDDYWLPGLTYGKRTDFIYAYPMPRGQIFSNEGMAIFPDQWDYKWELLGFVNSPSCQSLMNILAGQHKAHSYFNKMWIETPIIDKVLSKKVKSIYEALRSVDQVNETSINFVHPFLESETLGMFSSGQVVENIKKRITFAFEIYREVSEKIRLKLGDTEQHDIHWPDWGRVLFENTIDDYLMSFNLFSYSVGSIFARWDIRLTCDSTLVSIFQDPFDPAPICPIGMMVGSDGLPATPSNIVSEAWLRARPDAISLPPMNAQGQVIGEDGGHYPATIPDTEYPIAIQWDGILVDDPGLPGSAAHPCDIVRKMREVLAVLWSESAVEIEAEACEILGVKELRDYFRNPNKFFADHLKRYSKSRRKAPIYWPLSTASGSYTLWLYYHRLDDEILYTAVNRYVDPKIGQVERYLAHQQSNMAAASGRAAAELRDQLDEVRAFLGELRAFREELLRIAALPYKPNLNDGAIINAAPFHNLFGLSKWARDTQSVWDKLQAGEYDWAHMAYTLWPERVRQTAMKDRSIAIAHGLEEELWGEAEEVVKKKGQKSKQERLL